MTGTEITSVAFDYAALPADVAADAQGTADRLRRRMRQIMLQAGAELARIKARLPDGMFGKWLKAEFDMTERSAYRYIQAAEWAKTRSDKLSEMTPSVIYQLAAPSCPATVQEEVLARVATGEKIKVAEVNALCAEARHQARETARKTAEAERRAKLSRCARCSRAQREKEWAKRDAEREREQLEREANTREVAQILAERLTPAELDRIADWASRHVVYWDAAAEQATKLAAEVKP